MCRHDAGEVWIQPQKSLFGRRVFEKSGGLGAALEKPEWANKEINWIPKEGGPITFDRMANELQNPAAEEQRERPTPIKEEQWPRDRDHRNAEHVTKLVQRMAMLLFIIFDKGIHELVNRES